MRRASGAALATAALLAGCGGSGAPATTRGSLHLSAQEQRGRQLFLATCGACHALADAGTGGSAGPDLGRRAWRAAAVLEAIASGPGSMPAALLAGGDARGVAAYVAAATRR